MPRALGSLVLTLGLVGATSTSAPAQAPGITPADAETIAAAVSSGAFTPEASTDFVTIPPSGTPHGIADVALTSFPKDGATYGIMTSGNVNLADDANTSGSSGLGIGGGNVRGASDFDVSILRIDFTVAPGSNCLSFDFRFLSEEFPEFVNEGYNDAFIAELDDSTWDIDDTDQSIDAPLNFAFDPNGDVISINSSGFTSMSGGEATGTTYDGATPLLRASTPVTPGPHSVYFSIFDQGDSAYDSAVFLDSLSLGATTVGGCQPGASLPPPLVSKTADAPTSPAGGSNGYTITVTNPNDVPVHLDTITDTLPPGFGYVAGSTSGSVTGNPVVAGQTLTWQKIEGPLVQVPANGSVSMHLAVTVAETPGEYFNEAGASASGFAIELTGPTAPIMVIESEPPPPPPPAAQPCDPVTLEGTGAGETLQGTAGADRIRGLAGRDRIDGLGGDDELCGGPGGDYVYGRNGLDTLRGEEGNDRLYGGRGGDVLEGGPGHDAIIGGRGPDTILAADGSKDCIVTGRGNDSVTADPVDVVDPKKGCPPGFWL